MVVIFYKLKNLINPNFVSLPDSDAVTLSILVKYTRCEALVLLSVCEVFGEIDESDANKIRAKFLTSIHSVKQFEDVFMQALGNLHSLFLLADVDPTTNINMQTTVSSIESLIKYVRFLLGRIKINI